MIRLWNYNKSRIHSYRGARLLTCHLDSQLIFKGEVAKAPGNTKDPGQCCEILLFTDNESILMQIDRDDWVNGISLVEDDDSNAETVEGILEQERPMTATKQFTEEEVRELQRGLAQKPTSLFDERPQTKAVRRVKSPVDEWGGGNEPVVEVIPPV